MDVRIGARFRALRHRLGWRQVDLARRAGVSRSVVSLVERGLLERVSIAHLRAIAKALDADFYVSLRWRGGDLDRLLDEGHAALLGNVANLLRKRGWQVRPEVTYSEYGERGSIDLLAWHAASATLLVIEVKTELISVEETLRKHDEKVRLAGGIVRRQFAWRPGAVARLLVLPGLATPRRRVARHASVLDVAYPARGTTVRAWLRRPAGEISGILFAPAHELRSGSVSRRRIRRKAARGHTYGRGREGAGVGAAGDPGAVRGRAAGLGDLRHGGATAAGRQGARLVRRRSPQG